MPDWELKGRHGIRAAEDAIGEETYIERGPDTVVPRTVTTNLLEADAGKIFTTLGASGAASARPFNIPAGLPIGTPFDFYDHDGVGMRITVAGAEKVRVNADESAAAGYAEHLAPAVGQWLRLRKMSADTWASLPADDGWDCV